MNKQVLIISFWNPTAQHPQQGVFIHDQVSAICSLHNNIVFTEVNVLPAKGIILKKTIKESTLFNNKRITINLYSSLWKFYYVNPWLLARIVYRIIKKQEGINPSVIHSNVIFPCGIVAYLLARRMNARMIISEHWSKVENLLKHPLYRRIAMKAYHSNSAIICVSQFLSSRIARATHHPELIVIPNIIDNKQFTYQPKPVTNDNTLIFTCVAGWKPPKRLDLIIDALCAYAAESGRKIELRVVGNGIQADKLKARELPSNLNIRWLGYQEKSAINLLLHTSDFFLHASSVETFSIVTAEALSTGTPVVASNTGALPELINSQNGILVENNPGAWLEGIREIVKKQYNHEAIAIQNQNKYSPDTVGRSILAVYNKVNSEAGILTTDTEPVV